MVVTRRPGEAVRIGDALVTVVRLKNGRVKLAIDAPPKAPIALAERVHRGARHGTVEADPAPRAFPCRAP
jgi:sRNA-binding carbon storage regulator CsrA